MIGMNISEEDTLPDDVWKDSFDKLLDQRPVLRELNVIKRNVRASFNMNSSFENSNNESASLNSLGCEEQVKPNVSTNIPSESITTKVRYLNIPKNTEGINTNKIIQQKVVSTPVKRNTTFNPFKCTLSPIGSWDLCHFNRNDKIGIIDATSITGFNATPIRNSIAVNVEYVSEVKSPSVENKTNATRFSSEISPFSLVTQKWKSKQSKHVCFADKNTSWNLCVKEADTQSPKHELQPGKWRKSLNFLRRTQNCIPANGKSQEKLKIHHRKGSDTGILERSLTTKINVGGNRKSISVRPSSIQTRKTTRSTFSLGCNNFKRQILQRCRQRRILTFDSIYNDDYLKKCSKIGEGAFGEVFLYSQKAICSEDIDNQKTILKIIPIEGKLLVNGEVQKTFEQILPEIIISMELSDLNNENRKTNITSGFVNLQKVRCVEGQYPSYLQKLWEEYDEKKGSENDHPKCFANNQKYIVLELAYGGQDLEGFSFKNAEQSFFALQQIILTLAVAEQEYQFEHRDLHWGNVLVLNTNQENVCYNLDGRILTIPTKGIRITIIDYTLSRMTFNNYCLYNDLSKDEELFTATGDYQFEIYRMMRKVLSNKWEMFEPKTNIFWISYIISKLLEGVTYTSKRSKNHSSYLDKLKQLQKTILKYKSCEECARDFVL